MRHFSIGDRRYVLETMHKLILIMSDSAIAEIVRIIDHELDVVIEQNEKGV